jgi:cytochrome c oxidase subunit II
VRRGSIFQLVGFGLIFGAIAGAVAVLVPWLPTSAGEEADRIDFVFWFTTVICVAIFALVAAVILYSVLKFRVKPDDDSDGPPTHGHTGLEIVWTAVPAVLVTAISIVSAVVLAQNGNAGSDPLEVKVTARQFAWTFEYPGGHTEGVLRVPEGRHTRLLITAKDVLHSFWVPQLGQKQDAVPGQVNKLVITPNRTGTFPVICTELCGLGHPVMRTSVIIMPAAEFNAWLKKQGQAAPAPGGGSAGGTAAGAKLFTAQGCNSCHTFKPAKATGKIGPDLDQLTQEAQRAGKPLEDFIRESIEDPNAYIEPSYQPNVMPNFGSTLKPDEIDALVQYLAQSKGAK